MSDFLASFFSRTNKGPVPRPPTYSLLEPRKRTDRTSRKEANATAVENKGNAVRNVALEPVLKRDPSDETLRGPLLRFKREKPEDRFAAEIRVAQAATDFRGNATVTTFRH